MQHLLIDNFRGFKRTVISFARVNFLVGENSTGKTSILGLVNLLSSPNFWFSQDFNIGGHEFGTFTDLVSAGSPSGTQFTIGFGTDKPEDSPKGKNLCYLLTYAEEEALPVPSFLGRVHGENLVCVKRFGKDYRYHMMKFENHEIPKSIPEMFSLLEHKRDSKEIEFKELPKKIPLRNNLIPILSIIESIESGGKDTEGFSFILPGAAQAAWFAPIRTKPKRTYDAYMREFSPEGEHTPYLLRKMLAVKKDEPEKLADFVKALREFGVSSGLFEDVLIKEFSKSADSPFEVLIKLPHVASLRINSVGYGVSQALPLIVEMLARTKGSWYAIQQPEVHLHPRAQAALGDLLFHLAEEENKYFLIETHSDFTIDRFRLNYRKKNSHHCTGQILFFERAKKGNKVNRIELLPNGDLSQDQPVSYRRFFVREQMEVLGL